MSRWCLTMSTGTTFGSFFPGSGAQTPSSPSNVAAVLAGNMSNVLNLCFSPSSGVAIAKAVFEASDSGDSFNTVAVTVDVAVVVVVVVATDGHISRTDVAKMNASIDYGLQV